MFVVCGERSPDSPQQLNIITHIWDKNVLLMLLPNYTSSYLQATTWKVLTYLTCKVRFSLRRSKPRLNPHMSPAPYWRSPSLYGLLSIITASVTLAKTQPRLLIQGVRADAWVTGHNGSWFNAWFGGGGGINQAAVQRICNYGSTSKM